MGSYFTLNKGLTAVHLVIITGLRGGGSIFKVGWALVDVWAHMGREGHLGCCSGGEKEVGGCAALYILTVVWEGKRGVGRIEWL